MSNNWNKILKYKTIIRKIIYRNRSRYEQKTKTSGDSRNKNLANITVGDWTSNQKIRMRYRIEGKTRVS